MDNSNMSGQCLSLTKFFATNLTNKIFPLLMDSSNVSFQVTQLRKLFIANIAYEVLPLLVNCANVNLKVPIIRKLLLTDVASDFLTIRKSWANHFSRLMKLSLHVIQRGVADVLLGLQLGVPWKLESMETQIRAAQGSPALGRKTKSRVNRSLKVNGSADTCSVGWKVMPHSVS